MLARYNSRTVGDGFLTAQLRGVHGAGDTAFLLPLLRRDWEIKERVEVEKEVTQIAVPGAAMNV